MVADALATAAFALGAADGVEFLERHGVRGLLVTPSLDRFETAAAR
jgi:thiamine biosynthesis lipoprotein ApbE